MIQPNPDIGTMAAYALPDISAPAGMQAIVLAQNEHAYPPSNRVRKAVNSALGRGHLYPDADWSELRAAIASVHSLEAGRILCGSGSMELMLALALAYLSPRDRVLVSEYGYLFMRTLVQMVGASIDIAAEKDYRVDIDALLDGVKPETKLVFVVNPGNPSGSVIHNDEIRRLREGLAESVLLLIDEAYSEYVDENFHHPLFDLVDRGNTVVTRTFSKIYGLAGMRVGWGFFPPDIRDNLRKVLNPNNVSLLSQVAACAAMKDQAMVGESRKKIAQQRRQLSTAIERLGLSVVPSQTNFVLVKFKTLKQAASAYEFLRARTLIVRPMGGYGLPECLRITIGLEQHMQQTAEALGDWRGQNNE